MADKEFADGKVEWFSASVGADDLKTGYLKDDWQDGFVAFSATEERLKKAGGIIMLRNCLNGRSDEQGGPEGYLMEAGLWRSDGNIFEELSMEREGDAFFVQYWRLETKPKVEQVNCYFRIAKTFARGNSNVFSGSISTYEVIVPTERLRFYISR